MEPFPKVSARAEEAYLGTQQRWSHHGATSWRRSQAFYRIVDFKRDKDGVPGRVTQIEYDPNRSAHIALDHLHRRRERYIIAPTGLEVGKTIMSGAEAAFFLATRCR